MPKVLEAHVWERAENDWYCEPSWISQRLFQEEDFIKGLRVHDPCAGSGTIPEAALAEGMIPFATDIVDRGYVNHAMTCDYLSMISDCPYVVTNPPFDMVEAIARHALSMERSSKVALVFPTARLNAAHWLHGLPLSRIWFITPRPSMPPGAMIERGEKPGGGKMDYCWLVFSKAHSGPPEARWLRRDRK